MRTVGIYYAYWTQEWDVDFYPFIRKVKDLGFDQLEVNGGTIAVMDKEERKRLQDQAERTGIKLSYGIGLTPENNVSSLNESIRKTGVSFMIKMIKGVASMGEGGMIGGTVHSYWPAVMPENLNNKMPVWRQSIKSMKELVKAAEDYGVILNVEVINRFEQFLLNTSEEAVRYVEEIDSPSLGILLDTFHMNIEEDSFTDSIKTAGKYLNAMHLGEPNRKPPGSGRMPWIEIRNALNDVGFDGPLVMEPFVKSGGTVGRNIGVWRDLMPGADLDEEAAASAVFVRNMLV